MDGRDPNINARRLGLYLRRTREIVELDYGQAAAVLGCDADWLARVETGFAWPTPADVERMLERYGVRAAKVAGVMIDLAERPYGPAWIVPYLDELEPLLRDVLISEAEASEIRTYGTYRIPDLAQCERYARRAGQAAAPHHLDGGLDPGAAWELLDHRQRRPCIPGRFVDIIIDAWTLNRIPYRDVLTEQVRHLLDLSDRRGFRVRLVPEDTTPYEHYANPFDVLAFPRVGDRISLAPDAVGIRFIPDQTEHWEEIEREIAASVADSRALLLARLTDPRTLALPLQGETRARG
ncbi:Scr1 family TA system antitoxin-like transcriptional regulator [Actinomadura flavalba]|uniref:Scr1 family TA system antitoxin-like transcriptional regulator n=1 Tax=Actinomadura flavalba TaxID=1120938 RepID=UPI000380357D|nr:Scr1 family TA system antitoxin-like transcriptional regulator [Actinomadura flavalba]